jgi:16S rRNA (adenine1518-N6/adenine1519-N6)-dimethyltransferase
MTPKEQLLSKMQQLGISPKRSLGQNFLINPNTIQKILDAVVKCKAAAILEIGPGLGALTESLAKMGLPLRLIEMDREFAQHWREKGISVEEVDALKLDWNSFALLGNTVLVSNLPYQIAARLVIELSSSADAIQNMVLMFQREVADRIMAKPSTKDYGFLSVVAQLGWQPAKVIDAGAGDFYPPPKVASRVVHFKRLTSLEPDLVAFVKKAFENRRKLMLKNFPDKAPQRVEWLMQQNRTAKVRAEELSPSDFRALFEVWRR